MTHAFASFSSDERVGDQISFNFSSVWDGVSFGRDDEKMKNAKATRVSEDARFLEFSHVKPDWLTPFLADNIGCAFKSSNFPPISEKSTDEATSEDQQVMNVASSLCFFQHVYLECYQVVRYFCIWFIS